MPRSSIIAGLLGCFASVFGKLALSPESLLVEGARQLCASRMEDVISRKLWHVGGGHKDCGDGADALCEWHLWVLFHQCPP